MNLVPVHMVVCCQFHDPLHYHYPDQCSLLMFKRALESRPRVCKYQPQHVLKFMPNDNFDLDQYIDFFSFCSSYPQQKMTNIFALFQPKNII